MSELLVKERVERFVQDPEMLYLNYQAREMALARMRGLAGFANRVVWMCLALAGK